MAHGGGSGFVAVVAENPASAAPGVSWPSRPLPRAVQGLRIRKEVHISVPEGAPLDGRGRGRTAHSGTGGRTSHTHRSAGTAINPPLVPALYDESEDLSPDRTHQARRLIHLRLRLPAECGWGRQTNERRMYAPNGGAGSFEEHGENEKNTQWGLRTESDPLKIRPLSCSEARSESASRCETNQPHRSKCSAKAPRTCSRRAGKQ